MTFQSEKGEIWKSRLINDYKKPMDITVQYNVWILDWQDLKYLKLIVSTLGESLVGI